MDGQFIDLYRPLQPSMIRRTLHVKAPERQRASPELFRHEPIPDNPRTPAVPSNWVKGQLLNVRNAGHAYRITAMGEEYDHRYPERCLEFTSLYDCQQFVSDWYARQSHDPRAM